MSSNLKTRRYPPEKHQPWRNFKFAQSRLKEWGNPTFKPAYWSEGQKDRLTRVAKLVRKGSILDVGCGCGHLYPLLKGIATDYTGVDFKAMINICKKHFPKADWRVGNVYDLSSLGLYDTVTAIQLFIHLPNLLRPLKQCWTHTKNSLIFTLRIGANHPSITVNKKTGTLGRRYSREEIAGAISCLNGVGGIEAYIGDHYARVMYVRLNRKKGKKKRIKVSPKFFTAARLPVI